MSLLTKLIDIIVHLDKYLTVILQTYGGWTYAILFLIIFLETGIVITPFLPGDSLIFAVGALAATGSLNIVLLFVILSVAAIVGDTVNYWIGYHIGPKIFHAKKIRFLKKEHLDKTHAFYEKHGGKTIILARFLPVIRTFAPFVAGIGKMNYWRFISYNVIGGIVWVGLFVFGGYFFGNLPFVKENFSAIIFAIIATSIIPILYEFAKKYTKKYFPAKK